MTPCEHCWHPDDRESDGHFGFLVQYQRCCLCGEVREKPQEEDSAFVGGWGDYEIAG